MAVLCSLISQIVNTSVKCLIPRTWGTIKIINCFVNMEKYLQQVSHSLVSQGD
jgi:hypothetical protein